MRKPLFLLALLASSLSHAEGPLAVAQKPDVVQALAVEAINDMVNGLQSWCAEHQPDLKATVTDAVTAWRQYNGPALNQARSTLDKNRSPDLEHILNDLRSSRSELVRALSVDTSPEEQSELCQLLPGRLWDEQFDLDLARQQSLVMKSEYDQQQKDAQAKKKP